MLEFNSTWPELLAILIPALGTLALAWQLYRIKTSKEEEALENAQFVCMVRCGTQRAGSDECSWIILPRPIPAGSDIDCQAVPIELTRSQWAWLADAEELAKTA